MSLISVYLSNAWMEYIYYLVDLFGLKVMGDWLYASNSCAEAKQAVYFVDTFKKTYSCMYRLLKLKHLGF